jgi:hypothetical protein
MHWAAERGGRSRPSGLQVYGMPVPAQQSMSAEHHNVGMVQRGRSFGFALETAESLCIIGEFVGKKLQGDVATELQVFRLIHDAHASAANLAQDAVMGNCLPHGLGRSSHWLDMLGGC